MGAVTPQLGTRVRTGEWFLRVALMPEIRTMVAWSKIVESKEIADEERDSASGFGSDNRT